MRDCGSSVTRKLKRIAFPILWSEYFDACHAIVSDIPQGCDDFFQRQNAEPGQQPVPIFELFPRTVFRVVDMKDEKPLRVERIDRFDGRTASVKMKAIDDQSDILSSRLAHDLIRKRQRLHAAIRLPKKLERETNAERFAYAGEFSERSHGFFDDVCLT